MINWNPISKQVEALGPVKWIKTIYAIKGEEKQFAYLEVPQGVHLLAEHKGRFALIRQFRPAVGRVVYELPGGGVEQGEDIISAALRELKEEVGLVGDEAVVLGTCCPSLAFSNEVTWLVHVKGSVLGEQELEWDEEIQVLWVTIEELKEYLIDGTLKQASAFAALWFFERKEIEAVKHK